MPFRDGTGPLGKGPRSGRGAGPGSMNCMGRGFGGDGRGRRLRFGAPGVTETATAASALAPGTDQEIIAALKRQTEFLQNTLSQMKKRIEELEVQE